MQTNETPVYDRSDNPTGCCPRFKPEPWQGQELHFDNKPFVRASTISLFHVPLNMSSVFGKTWQAIQRAHAETDRFLVLSHDDSAWHGEHLFAVDRDIPGAEMVHLTGTFLTQVFEGPFAQARAWGKSLEELAKQYGKSARMLYFFYTTCPRCAKVYGKNYVVGLVQVS